MTARTNNEIIGQLVVANEFIKRMAERFNAPHKEEIDVLMLEAQSLSTGKPIDAAKVNEEVGLRYRQAATLEALIKSHSEPLKAQIKSHNEMIDRLLLEDGRQQYDERLLQDG